MKGMGVVQCLIAILVLAMSSGAAELGSLRILYVGDETGERAQSFRNFLQKHVASIETAPRKSFDPKRAESFDVVLVDWPQGDREAKFPPTKSPLGDRENWS